MEVENRFDVALVSVACAALAALWAVGGADGARAAVVAVSAGAVTVLAMVTAQVRVGLRFAERRQFRAVGLLLVALPVWLAAATLAALGALMAIPFSLVSAVLLSAALRRPAPETIP